MQMRYDLRESVIAGLALAFQGVATPHKVALQIFELKEFHALSLLPV